jgi:hypothetical protein
MEQVSSPEVGMLLWPEGTMRHNIFYAGPGRSKLENCELEGGRKVKTNKENVKLQITIQTSKTKDLPWGF